MHLSPQHWEGTEKWKTAECPELAGLSSLAPSSARGQVSKIKVKSNWERLSPTHPERENEGWDVQVGRKTDRRKTDQPLWHQCSLGDPDWVAAIYAIGGVNGENQASLPCQPLVNIKVSYAIGAWPGAQWAIWWIQNPEGTSGWLDSEQLFILIIVLFGIH